MVRILRRQQGQPAAVHLDFVEVAEVRIAPAFPGVPDEVQRPRFLVDAPQLGNVSFTAGDLRLQLPVAQIVEVELPPIVAL